MSVPEGPHGSLDVANVFVSGSLGDLHALLLTIADLDLHAAVPFGDILHPPDDFRHDNRSLLSISGRPVRKPRRR